jgi:zinc protease
MKLSVPKALHMEETTAIRLANGALFYPIQRGAIPALKLEICFPAGRPFEAKKGLAAATLQLLKGGTHRKSAIRLAEGFDHWGSSIQFDFYVDTIGIKLFVLEKFLPRVLPLLIELLQEPRFPRTELALFKRQQKEKLRSDESRSDVMAYRTFTERLFGPEHPYGYNSSEDSIEAIHQEDLFKHWRTYYNLSTARIFLSGCFTADTERLITSSLGAISSSKASTDTPSWQIIQPAQDVFLLAHPESVQTSIRLGRRLFTRDHPDYIAAFVFNAVLGGYYGSRLMQNLREKKGLTYHIYSSIDTFLYDGYFLISTEVDTGRSRQAVEEIHRELNTLQKKRVPGEELVALKNYLLGSFLHYFENAFGYSELIRMLSLEGGVSSFNQLVSGIQTITAADIQAIARKYFDPSDLSMVAVGRF